MAPKEEIWKTQNYPCPRIKKSVRIAYWMHRRHSSRGGGTPPYDIHRFGPSDCSGHEVCGLSPVEMHRCPFHRSLHPEA